MGISMQHRSARIPADGPMTRLRNVPLPEAHLVGLALGPVLHRGRPIAVSGTRRSHRLAGWSLIAAGTYLAVRSVYAAHRVDLERPDQLVTDGPYAFTRNPMYLAWALLHIGVYVARGSGWVVATFPPAAAWIHREVLREERALDERFGVEFRTYRAVVPRYLSASSFAGFRPGRDRRRMPWRRPETTGPAS